MKAIVNLQKFHLVQLMKLFMVNTGFKKNVSNLCCQFALLSNWKLWCLFVFCWFFCCCCCFGWLFVCFFIHMSNVMIYEIGHGEGARGFQLVSRPDSQSLSGWPSWVAYSLALNIMCRLFNQFLSYMNEKNIPAMGIGSIDVCSIIPLSLGLILAEGCKVSRKQKQLNLFCEKIISE